MTRPRSTMVGEIQPAVRETRGRNSAGTGRSELGCRTYGSKPARRLTPAGLAARRSASAFKAKRFGSTSTSSSAIASQACGSA
jgi:hypothetical protein